MMVIKKWPTIRLTERYLVLNITQKCPHCKTVVGIDSLNDLEYSRKARYDDGTSAYIFKYTCPYCNHKEIDLSDRNIRTINKHITIANVNMKPYEMMSELEYHYDEYNCYYALWLNDKYGVNIPDSLKNDFAAEHYKKYNLGEKFSREKSIFVNRTELERILLKVESSKTKKTTKHILDEMIYDNDGDRILAIHHCTDANGYYNYCLETNGSSCILLVTTRDGIVRENKTRILPRNYATQFYSDRRG